MLTVKEQWNDAAYEVKVRVMEHVYGDDLQREPPLVSDIPAARIFNWRLPPISLSRPWFILLQGCFFVRLAISDLYFASVCKIWGHIPNLNHTCNRCGYYNKEELHEFSKRNS